MRNYTVWTDGSCLGNPGVGGWSAICFHSAFNFDYPIPFSRLFGSEIHVTNNRMEMQAIISGLNSLPEYKHVKVVTDSKYCADGALKWHKKWILREWKGVANQDLWLELLDAIKRHKIVEFQVVRGHSKIKWNEECDIIAKTAAKARKEFEEVGLTVRQKQLEDRIRSGGEFDKDLAK